MEDPLRLANHPHSVPRDSLTVPHPRAPNPRKVEMETAVKERPILYSPETRWIKVAATRIGVTAARYAEALNSGEKICGGCLRSLPRDAMHFGTESKCFDGLKSKCRDCVAQIKKAHYARTRPEQRSRQKVYREANRERIYTQNAQWQRERNIRVREEMLAAYGGRCMCCGEDEPMFLELDHIALEDVPGHLLNAATRAVLKSPEFKFMPAPVQSSEPITRKFLAGLLRAADRHYASIHTPDGHAKELQAKFQSGYEAGLKAADSRTGTNWQERYDELAKQLLAFQQSSGITINQYSDGKKIGELVQKARLLDGRQLRVRAEELRRASRELGSIADQLSAP